MGIGRLPRSARSAGHRKTAIVGWLASVVIVTAEQVAAGSGTPQALDVSAIPYEAGEFNLNGIVARGARKLVVVNSFTGQLFRIKLAPGGDSIQAIAEITGATVPGGDGLLLDRGRLVGRPGQPGEAVVPEAQARRP